MKPDEAELLRRMKEGMSLPRGKRPWPRQIAQEIGMHPKRLWSICEKWARKGFYEYGVSCDLGWLIDKEAP